MKLIVRSRSLDISLTSFLNVVFIYFVVYFVHGSRLKYFVALF
jgi:hypothetical protein